MNMQAAASHLTPSQRFYRGEISLQEATKAELALARKEEHTLRFSSKPLYHIARVAVWILFPFALIIGLLSRKDA